MLAVSFEFNYLSGNTIGFNDPSDGAEYRAALESAATRLGDWLLQDATIQMDVESKAFDDSAIAKATSEPGDPIVGGGFAPAVIPGKIIDQIDQNGADADGLLEVFFFGSGDALRYVTDPVDVDADDEVDFQAVLIHELVHTLGFTSVTTADGSNDAGDGLSTPGTWSLFDQYLSDADGNRLIDGDSTSPTAFRMDAAAWTTHSTGGKGPDAGLFFDGPIATSVYGDRVPLFSPETFLLESSVSHLDSEGFPDSSSLFSPLTHLMTHAIVDGPVPQELTLLEKAILTDVGIQITEDTRPTVTAPNNIVVEANARTGFLGTNQAIADFLDAATAVDQFDPNPTITNNKPTTLALGQNLITFTATDASGNVGTATAVISVFDTTAPEINVTPSSVTFEATSPSGVDGVTLPFEAIVNDIVDPNPIVTFSGGVDYPIGTTIETYTVRDFRNNRATEEVEIIVRDTTAPGFSLPAEITIDSNLANGADLDNLQLMELLKMNATDAGDSDLEFMATPSQFPVGTTSVSFVATDDAGNRTFATSSVTVNDITLVVTTLDDELDADPGSNEADLSLREAISLANAQPGPDNIRFALDLEGSVLFDVALGQLEITDSLSILGLGMEETIVDAQSFARVFDISGDQVNVSLRDLTVRGGRTIGDSEGGAGIRFDSEDAHLLLENVSVADNRTTATAAAGAGIQVPKGDLTLVDSQVTGNETSGSFASGGGIWIGGGDLTVMRTTLSGNSTGGAYAAAGALYALDGTTSITDSSIFGNSTDGNRAGGGAIALISAEGVIRNSSIYDNSTNGDDAPGGGIRTLLSPARLVNSTVSGNSTQSQSNGGGIFADRGDFTVEQSTITGNNASGAGGGIGVSTTGSLDLNIEGSIVAGNLDNGTAPDFYGQSAAIDAQSVRFSLIGDNAGTTLTESQLGDPTTGNLVGSLSGAGILDPLLEPLADNGGPTFTHLLRENSPALDSGDPAFDVLAFTPPLINDQRGDAFPRLFGDRIDIGAVESIGELTITWSNPAPISFGTALGTDQLNATSNVPGTFTYEPAAGTILEPGVSQALNATFTPDDLVAFSTTTATVFIDVTKAAPTITWNDPAPIDLGTALSETQLNASANVPGSFTYTPAAGTVLDVGDDQVLSVVFVPDDTTRYTNAADAVLIDVNSITPVVTWENPDDITFPTTLTSVQLNATANVPGTFSYVPPIGALLSAAPNQTLTAIFTPSSPSLETVRKTVSINVLKADPILTWQDPTDLVVGAALDENVLSAQADIPGTFSYNPPSGTVLSVGANQPLTATFTPQDQGNYNTAQVTVFIDILAPQDFGDAPESYGVLLVDDGARHLPGDLFLGSGVEAETDGQPSNLANGDGLEEDGMTLVADLVSVEESSTGSAWSIEASEAGKLDAWIDFNGDGDWNDPGEQVHSSIDLVSGANLLSFEVPAGAEAGTTFARLRLSTAGGLQPNGLAADGEVEDHLLTILEGAQLPDASLLLVGSTSRFDVAAGELTVVQGATDTLRVPISELGSLSVLGNSTNQSVELRLNGGLQLPANGLQMDGGVGGNTLVIAGGDGEVDFTDPNFSLARFRDLDLSSPDENTVIVDASAVAGLSPVARVLEIVAGAGDRVVVADDEDWVMTQPIVAGDVFILTAENLLDGGEKIHAELANHWQNFVRPGDVNNDGQVSASDALRIINELGRREYSDQETQTLDSALGVAVWPSVYFDHNGDDRVTSLDALRVINEMARISSDDGSAEAESLPPSQLGNVSVPQTQSLNQSTGHPSDQLPAGLGATDQLDTLVAPPESDATPQVEVDRAAEQDSTESATDDPFQNAVDELLASHHDIAEWIEN